MLKSDIRGATEADFEGLAELIAVSARALSAGDYSTDQIEGALLGAWGVDSQLIADGTYYVAQVEGRVAACGGWSFRATDFGGDAYAGRKPRRLDSASEAARIRAFFVHPDFARRGLGYQLLALCEAKAREAGFMRAELTATLPGQRFYGCHGYATGEHVLHSLPGGGTIPFVRMHKAL